MIKEMFFFNSFNGFAPEIFSILEHCDFLREKAKFIYILVFSFYNAGYYVKKDFFFGNSKSVQKNMLFMYFGKENTEM